MPSISALERLRARAEEVVRRGRVHHGDLSGLRLMHEFELQAVELQLQNEELQEIERELEKSRAQYRELFDLAPVGYVVLDEAHRIVDANAAAAELLEIDRRKLAGIPLACFISEEEAAAFELHRRRVVECSDRVRAYFTIVGKRETRRTVMFESQCTDPIIGTWRAVLVDVTGADGGAHSQAFDTNGTAVMADVKNTLSTIAMSADVVLRKLAADSPARHHLDGLKQAALHGAEAVGQLVAMARADVHRPSSGFRRIGGDKVVSLERLPADLALIIVATDPTEGKIAAQYFRTVGLAALAVPDGFEALEALKSNRDRRVVVVGDAILRSVAKPEFEAAARAIVPDMLLVITPIRGRRLATGGHEVDFEGIQDAVLRAWEVPARLER